MNNYPTPQQYAAWYQSQYPMPQSQTTMPSPTQQRKPKKKKKAVCKTDFTLGAWVLGIVLTLIAGRIIYNEFQKPPVERKMIDARVIKK